MVGDELLDFLDGGWGFSLESSLMCELVDVDGGVDGGVVCDV